MLFPEYSQALFYGFFVILLFIIICFFRRPLKKLLQFGLRGTLYTAALVAINFLGAPFGFTIGINYITVLTCAFLGIPGVITLSLIRIIGL